VSRREFVRRGALIGLSLPFMSAIISACGSDSNSSSGTTSGSAGTSGGTQPAGTGAGKAGGTIKVASQKPAGPLDPVAMQDLGSYGIVAQSFEFLATLGDNDIAPGLAEKWSPNADGSEWTFQLRKGVKWQDGTDFTSADVAATMDRLSRQATRASRASSTRGRSTRPQRRSTLAGANGNFPYRLGYTPVGHHVMTTRRAHADTNGTGPFSR
jgi:peptide/nickel transport system substrate-binding protein